MSSQTDWELWCTVPRIINLTDGCRYHFSRDRVYRFPWSRACLAVRPSRRLGQCPWIRRQIFDPVRGDQIVLFQADTALEFVPV
jgi:hypothetical protein